jgi:signal transduction histidine kinase
LITVKAMKAVKERKDMPALSPRAFEEVAWLLPESMIVTESDGRIAWVNEAFCVLVGLPPEALSSSPLEDLMPSEEILKLVGLEPYIGARDLVRDVSISFRGPRETRASLVASIARLRRPGEMDRFVIVGRGVGAREEALAETTRWAAAEQDRANELGRARDALVDTLDELQKTQVALVEASRLAGVANAELEEKLAQLQRMENELRLAQKLESVGRLASGVAHEINTPVQFIGDHLHFLREAYDEVRAEVSRLQQEPADARPTTAADLPYLDAEVPAAFTRVVEGVARIAKIVRAMKAFAHDDRGQLGFYDVNHGLETTLEIAGSEFRHIADKEMDLGILPLVYSRGDQLNQVFLNLIVNAAHAIFDVVGNTGGRGKLTVKTRAEANTVLISIGDTGTGISEDVKSKMFDPFFSTKPVGRGTGQGLSLVWSVVVDHGGQVWVDTELGVGSTFHIRLPIGASAPPSAPPSST